MLFIEDVNFNRCLEIMQQKDKSHAGWKLLWRLVVNRNFRWEWFV
jgi:hypothetical protein